MKWSRRSILYRMWKGNASGEKEGSSDVGPPEPPAGTGGGRVQEAELCAPCLHALADQELGVGLDAEGRRICPHYFHLVCLRRVRPRRCPQCRKAFHTCAEVPSLSADPLAWGRRVSLAHEEEGPDSLEVTLALKALLPLAPNEVEAMVASSWREWAQGRDRLDAPALQRLSTALEGRLPQATPAPPAEEEETEEEGQGDHRGGAGCICNCGKVHVHRGDRVKRGPAWPGGNEDGGEGQLGSIVRDEEEAGIVFVQWDCRPKGDVCRYAWPAEPDGHEVAHVQFTETAAMILPVQEQTGLSSVAVFELLRRSGRIGQTVPAFVEDTSSAETPKEEELREDAPALFQRCRVLPDQSCVKSWFDACPPCRCSRPSCRGGVRWNTAAARHLGREGYVLQIDSSDNTVLVCMAGRCNCKVWYPKLAVHAVYDPDTVHLPRFSVGTPVECLITGNSWHNGIIDQVWCRGAEWCNRPTAPYRIKLEGGGIGNTPQYVIAPADADRLVRRRC